MKERLAGALSLAVAILPAAALALPKPQEGAAQPAAAPPGRSPIEVGAWVVFFVLSALAVAVWWMTSRRKGGGDKPPRA